MARKSDDFFVGRSGQFVFFAVLKGESLSQANDVKSVEAMVSPVTLPPFHSTAFPGSFRFVTTHSQHFPGRLPPK